MASLLTEHGGFYLRVLEEKETGADDEMVKVGDGVRDLPPITAQAVEAIPRDGRGRSVP